MNLIKKIAIAGTIAAAYFMQAQNHDWQQQTSNGYTYRSVTNDPAKARYYTLKNGLTVILSPSKKEPRIQAYVGTKAGSKTDPAEHTGLAHYLEHMLFKGTDKFGSKDWEKEKPYLDKINTLYEQYNKTTDVAKRAEIYKEIDKVSGEASKYAIANEYDKLMSSMGATGTNAWTSFEETVYTDDIPPNALDKYLAVQSERFRNPILRIFHTELEAVYEEKNRSLDNDGSKTFEAMFANLFPENNYGKQTTIGTVEHLKNPSLKAIEEYYKTYYVPNNMVVVLAGDFDPDEAIGKIDRAFAYMQPKAIPQYNVGTEHKITSPVVNEVWGPNPESLMLGYRMPGASSKDARILNIIGEMLTNGQAGLIDLDLVKKQKLLSASAFAYPLKDYSVLLLQGSPTDGQSLDEVRQLLLNQIQRLRKGDFSDDLIQSVANNAKKGAIEANENYSERANLLLSDFIVDIDRKTNLDFVDNISNITKQDIVNFANKYLNDNNYVAVYKRKGADKNIVKVEKPPITPVEVNRDIESPFVTAVSKMPENEIKPQWLDFNKDIAKGKMGAAEVLSVKNDDNSLFRLYYYFETGKWDNKLLPIAAEYLKFLGTGNKTAEQFSKDFYRLAANFNVSAGNEETYISLDGLNENFAESVKLLEDLVKNSKPDPQALEAYKQRLRKARSNAKENKGAIMAGLRSYAQYGAKNPFNFTLTDAELDALTAEQLTAILHDLLSLEHKVLYYGPKTNQELVRALQPLHPLAKKLKPIKKERTFVQQAQNGNNVLFADYDMVQAEINWVRNASEYNPHQTPTVSLFNTYFGSGMGSIVFQTIRESKALAYSSFANFGTPAKKNERNTINAYVGTQADKFADASTAMNELLNELPKSQNLFEASKVGLRKKLASERITQDGILFSYLRAQKLGNNTDVRRQVYEQTPSMSFNDLQAFHQKEFSGKPYTYCIVASANRVKDADMAKLGTVHKLTLEEIFGY